MAKTKKLRAAPPRRVPARAVAAPAVPSAAFPVVGIGASAGGLEALERFLQGVPAASGMAFVVVQHLDPTQKGMLVELLGRMTPLPVVQVTDGTRVVPDRVYVIPPNADMAMVKGVLHLQAPAAPRGLRLPIDFFFRSLADDLRQRAVAVVLSGMGSDGSVGARAIRDATGGVFVQDPSDAKFDGMPRSAIDAHVADVIAPAAELAGKIAGYVRHARHLGGRAEPDGPDEPDDKTQSALEKLVGLLRTASGHDFAPYKSSTLYRRIERRMGLHQITDIAHYVRYVRENPEEGQLLFRELLIGVTSFFRDPAAWEQLRSEVLPDLLAKCAPGAALRAWVPACSTGEEAYSLAMVFKEALDAAPAVRDVTLQVFATDIDATAVERARQGLYPAAIAMDVTPPRLARFFVEEDHVYRVRKEIRDLVVFATQNVLQDPPFTKLDLLTCRNLLIYLTARAQEALIPLFHYSLKPGGTLFLGSAETIGAFGDLFAPLEGKHRLYRRRATTPAVTARALFPSTPARASAPALEASPTDARPPSLQSQVAQAILARFAPAAVLTSDKGDVLYVSGRTGAYLELPAGKTNWNVLAMAREGLRQPLASAFQKVRLTREPMKLSRLRVADHGHSRVVDVTLEPLDEPALRGTVLVAFTEGAGSRATGKGGHEDRPAKGRPTARSKRVDEELRQLREDLRTVQEDAQTAQEELRSANEELQSTNEELQSTNEELTTSKEEMQSMNEELQTLNHELQVKVDDLSRASDDMKNLLDSTEIAVLFLDDALHVRRFTPKATTLIRLIPGDVGRPLADLTSTLDYPELCDDASEVLRTLVFKEKAVASKDGRRFSARIMPYRTRDNRIDGLVLTFTKLPGVVASGVPERRPS